MGGDPCETARADKGGHIAIEGSGNDVPCFGMDPGLVANALGASEGGDNDGRAVCLNVWRHKALKEYRHECLKFGGRSGRHGGGRHAAAEAKELAFYHQRQRWQILWRSLRPRHR